MIKVFDALIRLEHLEITPMMKSNNTAYGLSDLYRRRTLYVINNTLKIYHNYDKIERIVVPTVLVTMITDASLFHVSTPAPRLDTVIGKFGMIDVVLATDFNEAYIKVEYKKTWLRKIKLNEIGYSDVDDNILNKIIIEEQLLQYVI